MTKVHVLIIDPQNDFCDPKGSLFVNGANGDMSRLERMIRRLGKRIDDIHVTLDTHHYLDIAHPVFWINSKGQNPPPFTVITRQDVERGTWVAASPAHRAWALDYTAKLEANKRYALCVWPPHCLIGSWGTQVYPPLFDALLDWEKQNMAFVDYVTKGSNYLTEHYSALQADVPRPDDPGTQLNVGLIESLREVDILAIAGEALSHCVRFTVQDLIDNFSPEVVKKMVILDDASAPVTGFEKEGREFLAYAKSKGVTVSSTDQFLQ